LLALSGSRGPFSGPIRWHYLDLGVRYPDPFAGIIWIYGSVIRTHLLALSGSRDPLSGPTCWHYLDLGVGYPDPLAGIIWI
jgi:hypothetical protein